MRGLCLMTHLSQDHLPRGGEGVETHTHKKKTWWKKKWQRDHSTHKWIGSRGRNLTLQIRLHQGGKMSTIGSIYVRSNEPPYNGSKGLQVHAEPRAESVGEHNASMSPSRIQWRLMLPLKKSPFWDKKTFVSASHGKGDSRGLCRLLLAFQTQTLTVQKYVMTDVARPPLDDTYTGQWQRQWVKSQTPTLCHKQVIHCNFDHLLTLFFLFMVHI